MKYDIKDARLAKQGRLKIEWAGKDMPVLESIKTRFQKEKPLKNVRLGCCLHVTTETANLMIALKHGGASVSLCASNPLSTQDDVAASLVKDFNIPVFAVRAENNKTYYSHLNAVLDTKPHVTMDDGADLVSALHKERKDLSKNVIAGTEETTTGVIRLRALQEKNLLLFPVIAVNDAYTKHFFDNRYGTGQSTIDGILRATNKLLAGAVFVVCGYGWCGKGIAMRAHGAGANVIITEVDPLKALEAVMDGYRVMPLNKAASIGDIFVSSTGDTTVIAKEHFDRMKDGAMVANAGHFNVEIDIPALKKMSKRIRQMRDSVEEFVTKDNRKIYLLGEGRLINLASAEGHPPSVMDMSFANQALSAEYVIKKAHTLKRQVYRVPSHVDERIAYLKLRSMGIRIDTLTKQQKEYLKSWELGT
jgi:adenosylhomocysteinase